MKNTELKELYQACKWEAVHFADDCGMNTSELWAVVNNRRVGRDEIDYIAIDHHDWWREIVLDDYRNQRVL